MKQIPNDFFFSWVEKEIAEGRNVRFRLKGNSMFPLLRDGRDVVVLYPCTEDELRPLFLGRQGIQWQALQGWCERSPHRPRLQITSYPSQEG